MQNWTATAFPRSAAAVKGAELSHSVAPSSSSSALWIGGFAVISASSLVGRTLAPVHALVKHPGRTCDS